MTQNNKTNVSLYGASWCHKTQHYMDYLKSVNVSFEFLDVVENEDNARQLRSLYESGKLNFPTIVVAGKKLRNPRSYELDKWLIKKGLLNANAS